VIAIMFSFDQRNFQLPHLFSSGYCY